MMCGAMLATSGRVSVLAGMKEVGAILRLTTIISGESIMNDKGAVIVVKPSTGGLRAPGFPVWSVAKFGVVSSVGAAALDWSFTLAAVPEVLTIIIAVPDSCLYTAVAAGTSGILWVVPLSLCLRPFSRNFLWRFLKEVSVTAWDLIGHMENTSAFFPSKVILVVCLICPVIPSTDLLDRIHILMVSLVARSICALVFQPC